VDDDEPIWTECLLNTDGKPIAEEAKESEAWLLLTRWDVVAGRMEPVEVRLRSAREPRPVTARLVHGVPLQTVFARERGSAAWRLGPLALPGALLARDPDGNLVAARRLEDGTLVRATQDDADAQERLWDRGSKRRGRRRDVAAYKEISRLAMEEWRAGGRDWLRRVALRLGGEPVDNLQRDLAGLPRVKGGVTNYAMVEKRVLRARGLGFPMPPTTKERAA
jgi:hypothetical protein